MEDPVGDYAVLDSYRVLINGALKRHIESIDELPNEARQALRHASAGGKRVRPTLTLLACESVGGHPQDALGAALAIESVHCASIVVDDVIDENDVRHGQDSIRAEFGTDLGLMVAMVLTTRALRLVMGDRELIERFIAAVDELSVGEILDIRAGNVNVRSYLSMTSKKTGALFRLAAEMGGLLGGASPDQRLALRAFGQDLGIAFQIRDDVLDAVGDEDALGKPTGSDLSAGRPSMVSVLLSERLGVTLSELSASAGRTIADVDPEVVRQAVDDAMMACNSYVDQAARALDGIPDSIHRQRMAELLDYAASRWE
jgi:geranylgeranyl diphosphate synthase type I